MTEFQLTASYRVLHFTLVGYCIFALSLLLYLETSLIRNLLILLAVLLSIYEFHQYQKQKRGNKHVLRLLPEKGIIEQETDHAIQQFQTHYVYTCRWLIILKLGLGLKSRRLLLFNDCFSEEQQYLDFRFQIQRFKEVANVS